MMAGVKRYLALIVLTLTMLILAACSSRSAHERTASQDFQSQLESLQAPQGADPAVFVQLKDELARQLSLRGKITAAAPTGAANTPANVHFTDEGGGNYALRWEYRNIGDYDQNGTVGVTDITPIAMHYGHAIGTDGMDAVIHGQPTGFVGVSDVTAIAMNYGVEVEHYVIESAPTETGAYYIVLVPPFSGGTGGAAGWKTFAVTYGFTLGDWFKVYPVDLAGNPGQECAPLQLLGGGGTAPSISSVMPQTGVSGSTYTPVPSFTGDAATTIVWDFGGGATPNTWTDMFPSVTLGAAGSYPASLTLTNGSGSDAYSFTLTVTPAAPAWQTYNLVNAANVSSYISLASVFGKPAFAYINSDFGTMHYVRSVVEQPASSSNWIDLLADGSSARWYDGNLSLAEDQLGNPIITAWDSVTGDAFFLGSNLPEPTVPADWSVSDIAPADEAGSLTLANGVVYATLKALTGLHVYAPTTYPPTGPGDWANSVIDSTPNAGGNSKMIWNVEDSRMYVFHYNYTNQGLFTSHCAYPDILVPGSWATYVASSAAGNESGLYYDFAFDPASLSNNLFYIYTSNEPTDIVLNDVLGFEGSANANSFTFSWLASGTGENHGRMCSLAFGGGDVMAAYQGNDTTQLILNSAPFTTNTLPFTWTPQVVPSASSSPVTDTNMLVIGTNLVIVYGRGDGIYYATLPLT